MTWIMILIVWVSGIWLGWQLYSLKVMNTEIADLQAKIDKLNLKRKEFND